MKTLLIELADEIASDHHHGIYRRDGQPYVTHVREVARLIDEELDSFLHEMGYIVGSVGYDKYHSFKEFLIVAALLHDALEDADEHGNFLTREDLLEKGIPDEAIQIVEGVTKNPGESYFDFIQRISYYNVFPKFYSRLIKLADLRHNMSDHKGGSQLDKYRFAYQYLLDHE